MVVKTYRGMLANSAQDRIRLQTIKGKVGYKIAKFELMTHIPADANDTEHIVMIWKSARTTTELGNTTTAQPDFTVSDLLAVGVNIQDVTGSGHGYWTSSIFDNEIFNQDIYISARDVGGTAVACNYYLELEVIPLDDAGAEYTTLKDMRQPG